MAVHPARQNIIVLQPYHDAVLQLYRTSSTGVSRTRTRARARAPEKIDDGDDGDDGAVHGAARSIARRELFKLLSLVFVRSPARFVFVVHRDAGHRWAGRVIGAAVLLSLLWCHRARQWRLARALLRAPLSLYGCAYVLLLLESAGGCCSCSCCSCCSAASAPLSDSVD